MLEILEKIISILTNDADVLAVIPAANIFVGPVDVAFDKQSELPYPQINIHVSSEVQRSNPLNTRDTQIQLDIWSRNSQMEIEQIYEAMIEALKYQLTDQDTAHIFWSRLNGATDFYESDRRIWHRAVIFSFWSVKPNE